MSETALEINNLSFAYDPRRQILNDISLSVPCGRLIAIMGGSGSGKTTLFRNICGQVHPNSGTVTVLGRQVGGGAPLKRRELYLLRREMGVLFQFGGLFTDLSVFDNVAFPLREHWDLSPSTVRDIVMLKLESVGLRGTSGLFPSELSGGMRRRVGLARAVAMDPRLILYDEPFAGLDPISLTITAKMIRELNEALGATSLIVTHDIAETFRIVDYAYLISDGRLVAEGTPAEMEQSALPHVRQFMGATSEGPMSFHYPSLPLAEDLQLNS